MAMEAGVSVGLGLPKKANASSGLFAGLTGGGSSSGPRKLAAWLSLDADSGELRWASLEQRQGRPAEEGHIPVSEVLGVRNTGMLLEISAMGYSQPVTLDFGTAGERDAWTRYVELAAQVLTPDSERAALDVARASHKQLELEERRALNEERKKRLQEGLGMRFTAEAMMTREAANRAAAMAQRGAAARG